MQAKDAELRLKIVRGKQKGLTYAELSRRFGVNYHTVRTLWLRYEAQGEVGLRPNYSQCGRRIDPTFERTFRLVRLVKQMHPLWGIAYIVARIGEQYPDLALQSVRHYQRRLKQSSGKLPKVTLPKKPDRNRPRQAHDEWEIDAKERLKLTSGQAACFLNITDAKTNAILKAKAFPP